MSAAYSKWARERARAAALFLAQDQEEEERQEKALQQTATIASDNGRCTHGILNCVGAK